MHVDRAALAYGEFVVLWVVLEGGNFVVTNAVIYSILTVMAVWAHLKTMLTEPGVVPRAALPLREEETGGSTGSHTVCGRCDAYKPVRLVPGTVCYRFFISEVVRDGYNENQHPAVLRVYTGT